MITVTAGDFQREFGRYRDVALKEPISITHYGRETLVILSAEDYQRLKSIDDRKSHYVWDLPDEIKEAMAKQCDGLPDRAT